MTNDNSQYENHTILRCPHDKKNPYVMINVELVRDDSISPNCRQMLIELLSNTDGWTINIKQLAEKYKKWIGRDRVYGLIKEAIDAGYMKKEEFRIKGKRGGWLTRVKYYLSETPKFKKCFRHPENQEAGNQDILSNIIDHHIDDDGDKVAHEEQTLNQVNLSRNTHSRDSSPDIPNPSLRSTNTNKPPQNQSVEVAASSSDIAACLELLSQPEHQAKRSIAQALLKKTIPIKRIMYWITNISIADLEQTISSFKKQQSKRSYRNPEGALINKLNILAENSIASKAIGDIDKK